jgi:pimeloyl-ACP methyl ester carboxylesterase
MRTRCLNAAALASVLSSITVGMDVFDTDLDSGALGQRLAENIPEGKIDAPLFIAQGEADSLVLPAVQAAYVAARCQAGYHVDYRTYPGLGHVPLVEANSPLIPDLIQRTHERLNDAMPNSTCPN